MRGISIRRFKVTEDELEECNSMIYPNDANGDALSRMEAQGDDLTRSRNIDFTVAFADASSDEQFAERFRALGREVSVEATEANQHFPWDVVVVQHMLPSHDGITKFENLLQSVADGLGTPQRLGLFLRIRSSAVSALFACARDNALHGWPTGAPGSLETMTSVEKLISIGSEPLDGWPILRRRAKGVTSS